MAFDRAAPPALRWVALFLALCAALGLWMGFHDQMRRRPPDWYSGRTPAAVETPAATSTVEVREATPLDVSASAAVPGRAEVTGTATGPTKPEPEEKTETAAAVAEAPPPAIASPPPLAVPPPPPAAASTPRPKAQTPPQPKPAPSDDPVGDILEGRRPAETPPTVPY